MSGMGGWSGARDRGYSDDSYDRSSTYNDSRDAYNTPAQPWTGVMSGDDKNRGRQQRQQSIAAPTPPDDPMPSITSPPSNVDFDAKPLVSKAKSVFIFALDMTGSLRVWKNEIIKRGESMIQLMRKYTGSDDFEVLIIGFGDGPQRDSHPLMVAPGFSNNHILADYLNLLKPQGGGANGFESSQLVIQYALRMLDTSSATNVWTVIVTDEKPYAHTKEQEINRYFPGTGNEYPLETKKAASMLLDRSQLYCMFCEGGDLMAYSDQPNFKKVWQDILGEERVIPIEFKERVVDNSLLLVANDMGRSQDFMTDFLSRQQGSPYADVNIRSIKKSMSIAQGSQVASPTKTKRSILDI